MNKLEQMRRGIKRLIELDKDIGIITRSVTTPGERQGQQPVPTGEVASRKVICRVTYQTGSVWSAKQWEGGLTIDTSPFVLAFHDADIKQGDNLEWRGKHYTVGVVSLPDIDGGKVCLQAPLTEVAR